MTCTTRLNKARTSWLPWQQFGKLGIKHKSDDTVAVAGMHDSAHHRSLFTYIQCFLFYLQVDHESRARYLTITITRYPALDDDVDVHEQDHPYDQLDELSRFLFGNDQWMHGLLQQQSHAIPWSVFNIRSIIKTPTRLSGLIDANPPWWAWLAWPPWDATSCYTHNHC